MKIKIHAVLSLAALAGTLALASHTAHSAVVMPRHDDSVIRSTDGRDQRLTPIIPVFEAAGIFNGLPLGASYAVKEGWVVFGLFFNRSQFPLTIALSHAGDLADGKAIGFVNGSAVSAATFEVLPGQSYGWMVHDAHHLSAWTKGVFNQNDSSGAPLRAPTNAEVGLPLEQTFYSSALASCPELPKQNPLAFFNLLKPVVKGGAPGTDQATCRQYVKPPPLPPIVSSPVDKCQGRMGQPECPTGGTSGNSSSSSSSGDGQ